jgi:hypothetical protein
MKPHPYTCLPALLAIAGSLALLPSLLEAGSNVPPKPGLIITGKHVVVNDDDWNNDQIWDKVHKPGDLKPGAQNGEEFTTADFPNEGLRDMPDNVPAEPKLVPFTVTATPPPGKSGTLTITKTGGNVKLWKDEIKTSTFDLSDVGSKTSVEFWVEGIEPTNTLQDAGFDAKYHIVGQDPLSAEIRYGITRADIRVDSNNKTIPPSTEPLDEEDERIEFSTKPEHIGKILLENSGDVDHDGVMDSLDGLGLADTGGSAGVANLKLVPMKVKLEKPYDPTRAEVTFHYNASLPREDAKGIKKTVTNNVTTYEIAKRGLRLWKVDGDQRANGIDVTTTGGHFIPSGEPVPWRNLASSSATDTIIYLEYVDLPTGKTYSKEDIVYTIQENITEIEKKGYYKDSMNKTTYLAEKESPDGLCVSLLPVDLDIVHPAKGELAESDQHDTSKGGYVAVRRDDETPATKLVLRPTAGVTGMKYKVKFTGTDRFKLWKDAARTLAVTSEFTEFDPTVETVLFFEGLKKSGSVGDEAIILQAVIGGTVTTGETVYCTVVEAEFDVWVNVFIPIQWTDFPAVHPIHIDLYVPPPPGNPVPEYKRKIAAGDDRTFMNEFLDNPFSDVDDIAAGTACRAHSQLTIIPFSELDQDGIKNGSIKNAIGESFNYLKSHSVPDPYSGYSTTNRLLPLVTVTQSGRAGTAGILDPSLTVERYGPQNNGVRFKFEGSADNPIVNPSPAIDWDFSLAITVNNSNVLAPKWLLLGNKQDAFPAYEIYVRDSDGNGGDNLGTEIYKYDPIPLGRTPDDLFPANYWLVATIPPRFAVDETVTSATGDVP